MSGGRAEGGQKHLKATNEVQMGELVSEQSRCTLPKGRSLGTVGVRFATHVQYRVNSILL